MAFTVTATQSGATAAGTALRVKVLTGAAVSASQTGATTGQHATAAQQLSITTTVNNSQVYGAMWTATTGTFTANGSTTMIDNIHEGDGLIHGTCRLTTVGSAGAVTVGASAPTTNGSLALAEIIPNGTIAEDASGPAFIYTNSGTSATTASFTPPNSTLLLAIVSTNGGAGVLNMAISDTSGLGLTWTALFQEHPSGGAYAGLWVADMPGNQTVSGAVAALALAAPAGSVTVGPNGSPVAALALAAPAGTVAADGTVSGAPVAALALAAPAGSVSSSSSAGGGPMNRKGVIITGNDVVTQEQGARGVSGA